MVGVVLVVFGGSPVSPVCAVGGDGSERAGWAVADVGVEGEGLEILVRDPPRCVEKPVPLLPDLGEDRWGGWVKLRDVEEGVMQ